MSKELTEAEAYQGAAKRLRSMADGMTNAESAKKIRAIADEYERKAREADGVKANADSPKRAGSD